MGPHEDEHDEQTQEQVRRLLAAAAGRDEEIPQDVAGRLDGVLADLARERAADPREGAPVTGLASRRRRWGPRLLVAAAAVSVLALGVGVSLDDLTGGAGQSATSESAADGAAGGLAQPDRSAASGQDQDGATALSRDVHPPHVRSGSLEADLQRIEDAGLAVPVAESSRRWHAACVRPETGTGDEWLPVRFDGRPAVLVLRAPDGERRTADVFACGSAETPTASATLKAR